MNTDLADKYLELIGKRKLYPPLNSYSAFLQGSEYNLQKYYGKWYDNQVHLDLFIHMKEGYSQVWLPEDDFKIASSFAFAEYLKDPKFFERREKYILESIKEIDKIYEEYTYNKISSTDYTTLLNQINKIRDIIWDVNSAVMFTIVLDKQLCSEILKKEEYPISEQELNILWEKAVEPAFESFDKSQRGTFLKLVVNKNNWDEIVEKSQYILTDYSFARTLTDVEIALKDRYSEYIKNTKEAEKALESENKHIDNELKAHKDWLGSLPENERVVAEYLQTVMRVRDRRKNFFAKGMTVMYRIAEKMFSEAGIDRNLIQYYTVHELIKGVEYLKLNTENLSDRKKGFQWLIPCEGNVQALNIDIGRGVEKINKYFKDSHLSGEEQGLIKGQSGFKGIIKGRVRIVLNVNSNHGFTEGEILVAGMTRLEYVPLMKISAGIITDEGGITCHAAIVAREMKKPCVIGTKIATRVLKDGDIVEMDAEKGIVTIIKNN